MHRAVQAVGPGQLELTEKPLIDPQRVTSASASRPVAFAIPTRRRPSRARFRSSGTRPGQGLHCAQVSTRDRPLPAPISGHLSPSSTWKSPRWAI